MSGELCFLLSKHANDTSSDFVMSYVLVIFADDVNTKSCSRKLRTEEQMEGGSAVVVRMRGTGGKQYDIQRYYRQS